MSSSTRLDHLKGPVAGLLDSTRSLKGAGRWPPQLDSITSRGWPLASSTRLHHLKGLAGCPNSMHHAGLWSFHGCASCGIQRLHCPRKFIVGCVSGRVKFVFVSVETLKYTKFFLVKSVERELGSWEMGDGEMGMGWGGWVGGCSIHCHNWQASFKCKIEKPLPLAILASQSYLQHGQLSPSCNINK